jgi:hypothetical protein
VSGPEDPRSGCDWEAFRSARDRFFAASRPEAMSQPQPWPWPDAPPAAWAAEPGDEVRIHPAE